PCNKSHKVRLTHAATADDLPPQIFQDVRWSNWAIHAPSIASQSAIGAAICRQTTPSAAMLSKISPVIARERYAAANDCRRVRGLARPWIQVARKPIKNGSPKKSQLK